jgi:hypothetical protein
MKYLLTVKDANFTKKIKNQSKALLKLTFQGCFFLCKGGDEMELKDTTKLMESNDYKDRMKAEYWQTKIRYEKLHKMLVKSDAGTLSFEPMDIIVLRDQLETMEHYLYTLEVRGEMEGVDLSGI